MTAPEHRIECVDDVRTSHREMPKTMPSGIGED
jgi:hypothetical protein